MKSIALIVLLALVIVSPVHAFLRPRFPRRTAPPIGAESVIIIGDHASSIKPATSPTP